MRPGALRPATQSAAERSTTKLQTRLSNAEKRNRKRMAEVGTVYTVVPAPRSAADVLALFPHHRCTLSLVVGVAACGDDDDGQAAASAQSTEEYCAELQAGPASSSKSTVPATGPSTLRNDGWRTAVAPIGLRSRTSSGPARVACPMRSTTSRSCRRGDRSP